MTTKKIKIDASVRADFKEANQAAEDFQQRLRVLEIPAFNKKELTSALTEYQKQLSKLYKFELNTSNLSEYNNLLKETFGTYNNIIEEQKKLSDIDPQLFLDTSKIDSLMEKISKKNLQKESILSNLKESFGIQNEEELNNIYEELDNRLEKVNIAEKNLIAKYKEQENFSDKKSLFSEARKAKKELDKIKEEISNSLTIDPEDIFNPKNQQASLEKEITNLKRSITKLTKESNVKIEIIPEEEITQANELKNKIKELEKELNKLNKNSSSYIGVTSDNSQDEISLAIANKQEAIQAQKKNTIPASTDKLNRIIKDLEKAKEIQKEINDLSIEKEKYDEKINSINQQNTKILEKKVLLNQKQSELENKQSDLLSIKESIASEEARQNEILQEREKIYNTLISQIEEYFGAGFDINNKDSGNLLVTKKENEFKSQAKYDISSDPDYQKLQSLKKAKEELKKINTSLVKDEEKLANAQDENSESINELSRSIELLNLLVNGLELDVNKTTTSLEDYSKQAREVASQEQIQNINELAARWFSLEIAIDAARNQINNLKNAYLQLDTGLTQIAVVSGQTREEMWGMVGTFNDMAKRLGTTTEAIVESSKLYYQQGKTQSEVMEMVEQTSILAAISEIEYGEATEYLTAAINGYNLEASDAINVTDVWANLAAKAAVDTDELAIAMSKVASIASSAGSEIETTSAFLTKMIETTRESATNIGTALKTIIARFQELSSSTETLEDGVDANKVETALATAGVALRDATGQFRDFDDVILELSSKWDGLDRNTQRYIATIAAGSRQQSRFLALVDDYSRNLELVEMAQNSAGAAAAQFNTQISGLQSSINRFQAAWEGLYTSNTSISGFISWLITSAADLVNSFGDMGIAATAAFAVITFGLAKLTVTFSASATKIIADEAAKTGAIITTTAAIKAQEVALKSALATFAPVAATYIAVTAIVIGLVAAFNALSKAINKNENDFKDAQKAMQDYSGSIGASRQEIISLESVQKEMSEVVKTTNDLTEIKKTLIDQYPDAIAGLNLENATYQEINESLTEYIRLKQIEKGVDVLSNIQERNNQRKAIVDSKEYQELIFLEQERARILAKYDDNLNKAKQTYQDLLQNYTPETFGELNELQYLFNNIIPAEGTYTDELKEKLNEKFPDWESVINDVYISQTEKLDLAAKVLAENKMTNNSISQGLVAAMLGNDLTIEDDIEKELQKLDLTNVNEMTKTFENIIAKEDYDISNALKTAITSGDASQLNQEIIDYLTERYGLNEETGAWANIISDYEAYMNKIKTQITDVLTELGYGNIVDFKPDGSGTSDNIGDTFLKNYAEQLSLAANNPQLQKLLGEVFKTITQGGIDEALVGEFDFSTEGLVKMINNLEGTSDSAAQNLRQTLIQVLQETGDVALLAEEKIASLQQELSSIKSVVEDGKTLTEILTLQVEYGLSSNDFTFDPLTETYKLRTEAAEKLFEATKEKNIQELESQIIANEVAIQQNKLEIATIDMAISYAESGNDIVVTNTKLIEANAAAYESFERLKASISGVAYVPNDYIKDAQEAVSDLLNSVGQDIDALKERKKQLEDNNQAYEDENALIQQAIDGYKDLTYEQYMSADSTSSATSATDDYNDALKEQADLLKELADAEKERISQQIEAIQKVLEAKKSEIEKENEMLQEQIDKEKEAQEIMLEGYKKYLDNRKEAYEKSLEDLQKAAEEAREKADKNNEDLNFQNEIAQDYYADQIAAIDERINKINEEAEAENRLLEIQKNKDAYERAKNEKNRLVLVGGAGFVYQRDQNAIEEAKKALEESERELEIANLEKEKEQLQEQADSWAEKAENIGKTTEELLKYQEAYEKFSNLTQEEREQALKDYIAAIVENNKLNQDALDKEENYEQQSDPNVEGSIAWNIAKIEELGEKTEDLLNKIGQSAEEIIKQSKIEEMTKSFEQMFGGSSISQMETYWNTLSSGVDNYLNNFLALNDQISKNEEIIESIDQALSDWDELTNNLGKSTSELSREIELFNYYNQLSFEQLKKNEEVYNSVAESVSNLADQYERANAAQAAYEAAEKMSKSARGLSINTMSNVQGLSAYSFPNFIEEKDLTSTLSKRDNVNLTNIKPSQDVIEEDNSINYTNCKFEITSNEDSIEKLLIDVKNKSPLIK